jgi:uncharacterized repeat protein (TIGR01451 family)
VPRVGLVAVLAWTAIGGLGTHQTSLAAANPPSVEDGRKDAALQALRDQPLRFVRNAGQLDPRIRFYEQGPGRTALFTGDAVHLTLNRGDVRRTLTLRPLGGHARAVEAEGVQPARIHSFVGDASRWRTDIPSYAAIVYKDVYPGIDLRFHGGQKTLEYDVVVHPGADPAVVRFALDGPGEAHVAPDGDLVMDFGGDQIRQEAPVVYQEEDGRRTPVDGAFQLARNGGGYSVAFDVGPYDRGRTLVIDPVLNYSSYLGGTGSDSGLAVTVTAGGAVIVVGQTQSANFDVTAGAFDTTANGNADGFVSRFDIDQAGAASLVYSTYIGGSGADEANGVKVDSVDDSVYLIGYTESANFPTTAGARDTTQNGGRDAFFARLSGAGSALLYSTFLGTAGTDEAFDVAVDFGSGRAWITGRTDNATFPTTAGAFDTTSNGGGDAFVSAINPAGAGAADLVYSTYLGGTASDRGHGIAVTSFSGTTTVYVVGQTASAAYPVTAGTAFDTTLGGTSDAFFTRLNPLGAGATDLLYSTYLGGSGEDIANGVAVDAAGSAYLTGETTSNPFPTTAGAFDTTFGGVREAFVSKLNPTASGAASLVYSTYLGGTTADRGLGVSVDSSGAVCVAGSTASANFPTLNPVQAANAGSLDVFVTSLNPAGNALRFSTYLGGAGDEEGYTGIVADKCCVTGRTLSANFPVATGAFQTTNAGNGDAFVSCIGREEADLAVTLADAPDPVNAGDDVTYTVIVGNNGPHAAPGATVSFPIPAGMTFEAVTAPSGWTCTAPPVGAAGIVTCQFPSLAPAASAAFVIQAQVASGTAPGTVIAATVSVSSAAVDPVPANDSASTSTTVAGSADLSVTKNDSPDPVLAGQNITYSLTVRNNGPSSAASASLSDPIPANTTFQAVTPAPGWACSAPAVGGTGTVTCTRASVPAVSTHNFTIVVQVNPGTAVNTVIANNATVASATPDPVPANTGGASTTVSSTAGTAYCATPGQQGAGGTLAGVDNSYWPGTATAAAGSSSITLGARTGAAVNIASGNMVLVIQMQDAAINSSNTDAYGDGLPGDGGDPPPAPAGAANGSTAINGSGLYEYAMATNAVPAAGGVLTLSRPLMNTYVNAAATATQGQRRFQVVRVPQHTTATLGATLTAAPWDGTSGGILALDISGNLALGTTTVSVTGQGFRGGGGRPIAGGAGSSLDYRNTAANAAHGQKAEGIAGTPRFVYNGTAVVDTAVDGYPNGSSGRGAPGNAGGGGTDGNPSVNDQNSGGGGGGNGGVGGKGGHSWSTELPRGGFGGEQRPPAIATDVRRIFLGGGGGAGSRNNSAGVDSSGGVGGGLVFIRTGTVSGTGTLTANGAMGVEPDNDAGGGGGAGGTVVMIATGGALTGLTLNANGANGTNAWPTEPPAGVPGARHGPGGGGAGGVLFFSSAPTASNITGGIRGTTTTAADPYGATSGTNGLAVAVSPGEIPGANPGSLCGTLAAGVNNRMVKTDSPDPVQVGQPLTYTLAVQNLGAATATGVVATDTLPASVTFVSATSTQGTCTRAGVTVTCAVGSLPGLAQATITIVVIPNTAGTISNTASVTQNEVDTVPGNNSDTEPTTVINAADLGVTIADSPDPVEAGSNITYDVQVTNAGPSAAAGASLTFPVPANTNFQAITTPAGWSCSTPAVGGTGTITCTNPSVPNGAVADFGIVVQVNAATAVGTLITATANVASTTVDTNLANNGATTTTAVVAANVVTRATLRGLRVDPAGYVEFATGSQRETAAFNFYGVADARGAGERTLLNATPVRARIPDSTTPLLYSIRTAPLPDPYLLIEEIDERGRRRFMGPFDVADEGLRAALAGLEARLAQAGASDFTAGGEATVRAVPARRAARAGAASTAGASLGRRVGPLTRPRLGPPARAAKVEVGTEGKVTLTRAELEAAGLPPGFPLEQLGVYNQGNPRSFAVEADGITFPAPALSTAYTARNVFVVAWGGSVPPMAVALTPSGPPVAPGFTRVERNYIYVANAPLDVDPWVWDLLFADGGEWPYEYDREVGNFDLPALPAAARPVPVRLHVHGRTSHRHAVEARINGVLVGTASFQGRTSAVIEGAVSADVLRAGINSLTLGYTASGGNPSELGLLYLGDLEIRLPEDAAAVGRVDRIAAYEPTLPAGRGTDYLVITHADFRAQAERLAAIKRAEGLNPLVVDVERAYDLHSGGIVEAQAVRRLIQSFGRSLRYVVLLGDDTFDTHDYLGTGAVAYVPSLLAWDGEFGRVPSENRYADLDGDGRPDVAIGRLPAQTAADAEVMVDKIEQAPAVIAAADPAHVFAVDNTGPLDSSSFRNAANAVALMLPAGSTAAFADVADGITPARDALFTGLRGALATHYFGHAGPELWADEGLLTVSDVPGLVMDHPTVLFVWACEAGWYQNLFGPSINEALLLAPDRGAMAAFGPSGATEPTTQKALYARVYGPWLEGGVPLGEAIRQAKIAALAGGAAPGVIEGWNLLGDPSLPAPPR